ncbi:hypothetical protein N752_17785 [Desulforamulus aquiferis]|nr:cytochrome ubiquinol oxidase subunit I [Desulforamulus aquiferis]RYD03934.1 hypothetical protein N752_17785 [Desulforamulus aquiferis]
MPLPIKGKTPGICQVFIETIPGGSPGCSLLQGALGHYHAVQVAETQPAKLAAFEGLFETQQGAPLIIFGIPDAEAGRTKMEIALPKMLSFVAFGDFNAEVKGLNDFPRDEWPPLAMTFYPFHLMVALGLYFIALTCWGFWLLIRNKLYDNPLFLKLAFFSIPLPFITNELGWIAAEVGRQPWVVYNLLRTADGVSITVPAYQILFSIIMFALIYVVLFSVWIFLLRKKINLGPICKGKELGLIRGLQYDHITDYLVFSDSGFNYRLCSVGWL